jgi:hypothetical protein
MPKRWTDEENTALRMLAATGASSREIAGKLNAKFGRKLTPHSVLQRASILNVPINRKKAKTVEPITTESVGLHGSNRRRGAERAQARKDLKVAREEVGQLRDARARSPWRRSVS